MSSPKFCFSEALKRLKEGLRVRIAGEKRLIYLESAMSLRMRDGVFKGQVRRYAAAFYEVGEDGVHRAGWVPNAEEMLSNDWCEVDE